MFTEVFSADARFTVHHHPRDQCGAAVGFFEAVYAAALSSSCVRVSALSDVLPAVHEASDGAVIVIHWPACTDAHYLIELLAKDPRASNLPLFVACDQPKAEDLELWKEYSVGYAFAPGPEPVAAAAMLLALIAEDREGSTPRAQRTQRLRRFFHLLQAGDNAAAARLLGDAASQLPTTEVSYLRGHLQKSQRELGEAYRNLATLIGKPEQRARAAPRLLHLMGQICFKRQDYKQARSCFEAALKASPRHLHRQLLLGQVYIEMQEPVLAIQAYKQIFTSLPAYPGLHVRLVELVYARAQQVAQIDALGRLFPYIPDSQLIVLHKKAELGSAQQLREHFHTLIARELIRRCDRLRDQDNHYGAINFLVRAARLTTGNSVIQAEIHLFTTELHLATGNTVQASEHLAALQALPPTDLATLGAERISKARARLSRLTAQAAA